jgi:3-oxoadipate enol-lactonase
VTVLEVDGHRLYYRRAGIGPRLVLINGSGATVDASTGLAGLFASSFDLMVYDQRGLGRSSPVDGGYTMSTLASDVEALLDDVGWDTASVLGISFGGMVAQELAVTAPHRVDRLVLLCTSAGGPGGSSYPLHELVDVPVAEGSKRRRRLLDTRFDDSWLASHPADRAIVSLLEGSPPVDDPVRERGELAQLQARRFHDVWERLGGVTAPTLVGSGRYDGIAPLANGQALAARIPSAQLRAYEGGHAFLAQDPRAVPEVIEFITAGRAPDRA